MLDVRLLGKLTHFSMRNAPHRVCDTQCSCWLKHILARYVGLSLGKDGIYTICMPKEASRGLPQKICGLCLGQRTRGWHSGRPGMGEVVWVGCRGHWGRGE